jgi:hypothetical protein
MPSSAQKAVDAPAIVEKLSKVGSFGTAQNRIELWHPPLFRCFAQLLLLPLPFHHHHHKPNTPQKSSNTTISLEANRVFFSFSLP